MMDKREYEDKYGMDYPEDYDSNMYCAICGSLLETGRESFEFWGFNETREIKYCKRCD